MHSNYLDLVVQLRPNRLISLPLQTAWSWNSPVVVWYHPDVIRDTELERLVRAETFRYRCRMDICPFHGEHEKSIWNAVDDVLKNMLSLSSLDPGGYRALRSLLPNVLAAQQARINGEDIASWKLVIQYATPNMSMERRARLFSLDDADSNACIAEVLSKAHDWKQWPNLAKELTQCFLEREKQRAQDLKQLLHRGRGRPGKSGDDHIEHSFSDDLITTSLLDEFDTRWRTPPIRSKHSEMFFEIDIGKQSWRPGRKLQFGLLPDIHTGRPNIPAAPIYTFEASIHLRGKTGSKPTEFPPLLVVVDVSRSMGLPDDRDSSFYLPVLVWIRRLIRDYPGDMALTIFAGKALYCDWSKYSDRQGMLVHLLRRPDWNTTRFPLDELHHLSQNAPDGWQMLLISDLDWQTKNVQNQIHKFLLGLAERSKLNLMRIRNTSATLPAVEDASLTQAGARIVNINHPNDLRDMRFDQLLG